MKKLLFAVTMMLFAVTVQAVELSGKGVKGYVVADFNGDKCDDLMVFHKKRANIYFGCAEDLFDKKFKMPSSAYYDPAYPDHPWAYWLQATLGAAGDFNGDGHTDVVMNAGCGMDTHSLPDLRYVSVYLNNGDGTFGIPICITRPHDVLESGIAGVTYPPYQSQPPLSRTVLIDFNGNCQMDTVVLDEVVEDNAQGYFYPQLGEALCTWVDPKAEKQEAEEVEEPEEG